MAALTDQSYWALVAQTLPWYCFAGVSLSPYRREPFLRSTSLGQGVVLYRWVFRFRKVFLFSIFRLKLCNRIWNSKFDNKVQLSDHSICLNHVCDVLCVISSVITPRNDHGLDRLSLFKGGTSQSWESIFKDLNDMPDPYLICSKG
jgi:hypothetical protein